MKALIFNSGLGRRMGSLTEKNPKCMVKLYNGETIFERQIRILNECGIKDFVITVGPFKEQVLEAATKFPDANFTFVSNDNYAKTNYIVSMHLASRYFDDDFLVLHGDLVFNKNLIIKLLNSKPKAVCLYNDNKELPAKDFKGRFKNGLLKEVAIDLFDNDSYAFQPFYKLDKETLNKWGDQVTEFVTNDFVTVYAENALNEITDQLEIAGMNYKDDYIEEIDDELDYFRVSNEIRYFDYSEQEIIETDNYREELMRILTKSMTQRVFVVSGKSYEKDISKLLSERNVEHQIFDSFAPNPDYHDIILGLHEFKKADTNLIISIGGGSAMDVAKSIKAFSSVKNGTDFLDHGYEFSNIKHIAIPTTAGTGSESTTFAVIYDNGDKKSITHDSVLPDIAILDYNLLKTLPDYQKKSTMLDALCQSIESIWSKRANESSKKDAEQSIEIIHNNYQKYLMNDKKALRNMLYAANLSGKAINISKTTLPHAMSYKLASRYKISHGHAVALSLPYVWELLIQDGRCVSDLDRIAKAFRRDNTTEALAVFKAMYEELKLGNPVCKDNNMIEDMVNAVNMDRLNNTPLKVTNEMLRAIYSKILE